MDITQCKVVHSSFELIPLPQIYQGKAEVAKKHCTICAASPAMLTILDHTPLFITMYLIRSHSMVAFHDICVLMQKSRLFWYFNYKKFSFTFCTKNLVLPFAHFAHLQAVTKLLYIYQPEKIEESQWNNLLDLICNDELSTI